MPKRVKRFSPALRRVFPEHFSASDRKSLFHDLDLKSLPEPVSTSSKSRPVTKQATHDVFLPTSNPKQRRSRRAFPPLLERRPNLSDRARQEYLPPPNNFRAMQPNRGDEPPKWLQFNHNNWSRPQKYEHLSISKSGTFVPPHLSQSNLTKSVSRRDLKILSSPVTALNLQGTQPSPQTTPTLSESPRDKTHQETSEIPTLVQDLIPESQESTEQIVSFSDQITQLHSSCHPSRKDLHERSRMVKLLSGIVTNVDETATFVMFGSAATSIDSIEGWVVLSISLVLERMWVRLCCAFVVISIQVIDLFGSLFRTR